MRCNECGGEWTPPPGKSVNSCPFCFEPIQTPPLEASSDNVIKALVLQLGEGILLDPKLFSRVADKLKNQNPQMLKRMRLAIKEENVPAKLYAMKPENEQERIIKINVIAEALKNDYDMGIDTAYEVVNFFADSLGYKPVMAPKATPQHQSAPMQENQSVKPVLPPTKSTPKVGSIVPFGKYEWRVLEVDKQNNRVLILSDIVIGRALYSDKTWESCKLRGYLNGEFYNSFSGEEKKRIKETKVVNKNNPWYGTNGGRDTDDRIFLLSIEEVVKYFGDSGQLMNRKKDQYYIDDQYNTARVAKNAKGEACWWWLRSPGCGDYFAAYVNSDGIVDVSGYIVLDVFNRNGGVRPALWLNL